MPVNEPVAHISPDGKCQTLRAHLIGTAPKAADMSSAFGCSQWGYLAGLWHDLGENTK